MRLGFHDRDSAPSPTDLGADRSPSDLATADVVAADLAFAGLNDPCNPPPCTKGLVCTGTGPVDYCRPACTDTADCPDGEVCGKPVGKLTVPMACLSVKRALLYEGCAANACEPGLVCSTGDEKVCLTFCASQADCDSSETCIPMGLVPLSLCHPKCSTDQDCPSPLLRCGGFGPFPGGYCTPTTTAGAGGACKGHAYCKVGLRCIGTVAGAFCYATCPQGSGCSATQTCITRNQEQICFLACTPLDSPVKCASHEVCYPDPVLAKAYCLPGKGDPSTCSTSVPCVSGKICVATECLQVCDTTHPCPTGKNCLPLSYQGTPGPWKACK